MMIQTIKTLKLNFTYVNLDKIFFLNDMRLILFTRPDCTYFFPFMAEDPFIQYFEVSFKWPFQNLVVVTDEKSPNQESRVTGKTSISAEKLAFKSIIINMPKYLSKHNGKRPKP